MAIKAIVFDCFGVLYDEYTRQYNQPLIEVIASLRRRYKVGVLSNAGGGMLRGYLERGGIADAFDAVVASGETDYLKPQREIFEQIAAALDVKLSEILFFDDSQGHVQGAQAHGVQAVQYRSMQDVRDALLRLT